MSILSEILSPVAGWLALLGVGLLGAFAAYLRGRSNGKASERAKQAKQTEREVGKAANDRRIIDALPDEELDEELSKWDRKP